MAVALVNSAIVSAVMMATLVVGPFYLSGALGLAAGEMGLVMAAGPLVVAVGSIPAGRLADRFGADRTSVAGLLVLVAGCSSFSLISPAQGVGAYVMALVTATAGYAIFQTANNSMVMAAALEAQRGAMSGTLNLSRNFGLITGAAALGALFDAVSGAAHVERATAERVAAGMSATFAAATLLVTIAAVLATGVSRSRRGSPAAS